MECSEEFFRAQIHRNHAELCSKAEKNTILERNILQSIERCHASSLEHHPVYIFAEEADDVTMGYVKAKKVILGLNVPRALRCVPHRPAQLCSPSALLTFRYVSPIGSQRLRPPRLCYRTCVMQPSLFCPSV